MWSCRFIQGGAHPTMTAWLVPCLTETILLTGHKSIAQD